MIEYIVVSTLRCFQHASKEGVGTCKKCGRGICAECALSIDWDIYCEPDAEKGTQIRDKDRISPISTAPIILYITGTVQVISSFLLLAPNNTTVAILSYSMGFGIGIALLGIAYFPARGLFQDAKGIGSILAFTAAAIGIILNAMFMPMSISSVSVIMLCIAVIALIALGWKPNDSPFCTFVYHI